MSLSRLHNSCAEGAFSAALLYFGQHVDPRHAGSCPILSKSGSAGLRARVAPGLWVSILHGKTSPSVTGNASLPSTAPGPLMNSSLRSSLCRSKMASLPTAGRFSDRLYRP